MNNRIYPIGIQNFEKIRTNGYIYVDKTALVYKLVKSGCYYFLSRPRRFGKSLLISTLEAYFQGKKELFEGLAISELEKDWTEYPVLHLDLNVRKYDSLQALQGILDENLKIWEEQYGNENQTNPLEARFSYIVEKAYETTGKEVVILIDEYDKPLLQTIGNKDLQKEYRDILKAFYGVLKSKDKYIRFAMLTGVTKFGKVSVFSDLNNLIDLSMDWRYYNICGISEEELLNYFNEDIHELAEQNRMTFEQTCTHLKERYDGYHFTEDTPGMYNPFSLLNTFDKMRFGNYWFETGTPTYLVKLLQLYHYNLNDMENEVVSSFALTGIDASDTDPIPVIYQSGYLTIKDYNSEFGNYTLKFPNKEVEEGFIRFLIPYYTPVNGSKSAFEIQSFVKEVRSGDIDGFFTRLRSFFSDTTYEVVREQELHYENVLYIIFKLLGFYTQVEYHTHKGRIDLVLKTSDYIYIMEFKLNGSAEEALQQINEKGYARPFETDGRKIFKIGVNFGATDKNIERWVVE